MKMPPKPKILSIEQCEKEFIKTVERLAYAHSRYDIFNDFVELAYCALRKKSLPPGPKADELEKDYMSVVKRHKPEVIREMPGLVGLTAMAIAHSGQDFLGRVGGAMELFYSDDTCFTPWNVASMMARMQLDRSFVMKTVKKRGFLSLAEPACGAGVMVLAAAAELSSMKGFRLEHHLFVDATDIKPVCFRMTYVQLTLRGVPALVHLGDSLAMQINETAHTPAMIGFLKKNAKAWKKWRSEAKAPKPAAAKAAPVEQRTGQILLDL